MANLVEDFEDSTFNVTFTQSSGSDLPWARSQVSVRSGGGSWAYKSGDIADSGDESVDTISSMDLAVPEGATHIQFWYLVSSEEDFDWFTVYLYDGSSSEVVLDISGDGEWTQSDLISVSGIESVIFQYAKDEIVSENLDAAFIDDVTFTVPTIATPVGIPGFTSRPNRVWRLR